MNFKVDISFRFIGKALTLILILLVSVNLFTLNAQAFVCSGDGSCVNCCMEGYRHSAEAKQHTAPRGCESPMRNSPCNLEETGIPSSPQFIIPNGRVDAPDFAGLAACLPAEIAQVHFSNYAGFLFPCGSDNHHTPIYLQNLSLRC